MRKLYSSLAVCLFAAAMPGLPAFARSDATPSAPAADAPPTTCDSGIPGGVNCIATKKDLKEARDAYSRGLKLQQHNRLDDAFAQFDQASHLVPQDILFLSAREVVKAQLVYARVERGNAFLADANRQQAALEFRAALKLDPYNEFAQQRLQDSTSNPALAVARGVPALLEDAVELHLQPNQARASFHYRGDVRGLFTQLASSYGMSVVFDDSVPSKPARFYVDDVDFFTALGLASKVGKAMWTPLSAQEFLVASDTVENHKQFDRMSLATFSLPSSGTEQDAHELINSLRNICDFQKISSGQGGTLEVRAPQPVLEACTKLLQGLTRGRPQVMLDIQVYAIDHQFTRNVGLHIPDTFTMYNIPAVALVGLAGQSITSLVNQLISSGGVNQAGSTAISGLLAQLQGQSSSIFSQPLATFGGGLTFSGVSLDQLSAALSLNESWARSLSHLTMYTAEGNEASFHLGERYPILNASYAPIYNSPAISQVIGNQSYQAPFPSVSYEDLGLNVKAKPVVHGNGGVSLALELQVRSLTGDSSNGVPVIANREYKGSIRLEDGEPAVVAGEISASDQLSMSGIPGLGFIPGLSQIASNNTRQKEDDELLIIITPHVLANHDRTSEEIWVSGR
jgi:tetratricopeptide (TPR) repeat protein